MGNSIKYSAWAIFVHLFMFISFVIAAEPQFNLNHAQQLIYTTSHLKGLESGDKLIYQYLIHGEKGVHLIDKVVVNIHDSIDTERKNVSVDFLTGEQHFGIGPLNRFRGNPVIMAVLEHDVREMSRATGGGLVYLRNRIRDEIARNPTIDDIQVDVGGHSQPAKQIVFEPFKNDNFIKQFPDLSHKRYSITFSDAIAGQVYEIEIKTNETGPGRILLKFDPDQTSELQQ